MRNKWIKTFIMIVTIVPWSVVIILLVDVRNMVSNHCKQDTILIIENKDTISNKTPVFLDQTPEEGLREALLYYDLHHKDIIYAQAILETGNFKSKICIENNNLFGLYNSKEKEYYKFNHWSESVIAYKEWIQKKYQPPNDYYMFLKEINYAENENYITILKSIVNKNDTRRSE